MKKFRMNNKIFRAVVDFVPKEGYVCDNGVKFQHSETCVTSLFVTGESILNAEEKMNQYLENVAIDFEYLDRPNSVDGLDFYEMDLLVLMSRGTLPQLHDGSVVMGWIP